MLIHLQSSACRHPVRPVPSAEDAFFFFNVYFLGSLVRTIGAHRCVYLRLNLQLDSIDQSGFMPMPCSFY